MNHFAWPPSGPPCRLCGTRDRVDETTGGDPAPRSTVTAWSTAARRGRCKEAGRARVRGWPLNCDLAALSIKHRPTRNFFAQPAKILTAALDTEPPRPHWPETKGQAHSLARGTGPSAAKCGQSRSGFQGQDIGVRARPQPTCPLRARAALTATVTATAATNDQRQRPATAHNGRTIRSNLGYVRPEKRTVRSRRAGRPGPRPLRATLGATGANDLLGFRTAVNNRQGRDRGHGLI